MIAAVRSHTPEEAARYRARLRELQPGQAGLLEQTGYDAAGAAYRSGDALDGRVRIAPDGRGGWEVSP